MSTTQAIVTLATIPAILAIVNLLKGAGMSSKAAPAAAVALGAGLALADYYLGSNGAYQAAVSGVILGLGAAGLYDYKRAGGAS